MSAAELLARIEDLEIRLSHQEAAIDELTRTVLTQERTIHEQAEALRRLERQLRAALPSPVAAPEDESPPPHY
ncbi:MAG: SlyX family protein [Gammaproteobacteria bacterium]|jgi:SlyX protein|nr:SlyX family protein [Gammaproteobacteria bacterium]